MTFQRGGSADHLETQAYECGAEGKEYEVSMKRGDGQGGLNESQDGIGY